jgi:hypothetical protein
MGWDWVHLVLQPQFSLLHQSQIIDDDDCGAIGGMQIGKTCPSVTLSTTNPTWPDPGSNPDRRGGKSATNCLIYGRATPFTN